MMAVIFDLFHEIFKQDFFGIADIIKSDQKFTLKEIAQHKNFNSFASKTIESLISKKYASDIVEILHQYKSQLFSTYEMELQVPYSICPQIS